MKNEQSAPRARQSSASRRRRLFPSTALVLAGGLIGPMVAAPLGIDVAMAGTPYCGDGYIQVSEACDDNNFSNNDGCSAACEIEAGYSCTGQPSQCSPTATPTPSPTSTPEPTPTPTSLCGNSNRDTSGCSGVKGQGIVLVCEECDDGNTAAGDGCDATCHVEEGWGCEYGKGADYCTPTATPTPQPTATPAPTPTPLSGYICGDGVVFAGSTVAGGPRGSPAEQCDDNNTANGDGCSGSCTIEAGYTCNGQPSVCSLTATPTPAPTATPEPTVTPEPTATPAAAECGNGLVETGDPLPNARAPKGPEGEECDDGNTEAGDGCDGSCVIEEGYTCENEPAPGPTARGCVGGPPCGGGPVGPSDCYLPLGLDRIVLWPAFQDYGTIIARGHTDGVVPLDVDGGMEIVVRDAGSAPGLGQEVGATFTAAECVVGRRGGFICTDEGTPGRLVNRVKIVEDRRSGGYKIKIYLATTVMELGLYGPAEMDIVLPSGATYRGVAPNCRGGVPPEERLFCLGGVY